ncbi:hypothetical protein AOCH_003650 [Aspergillus ochraceoroseus]|uniref:DH domain-containing protein n=1 Tax=Aspergillus ochraceoroseus TaxID=138278 RepID=A0A0F8VFN7_9EURO|nr:hypothetical protein AOCH_003650 [Aspergillus ochraceoroseus]
MLLLFPPFWVNGTFMLKPLYDNVKDSEIWATKTSLDVSIESGRTMEEFKEATSQPPVVTGWDRERKNDLSLQETDDVHETAERVGTLHPFRRWVNSFRARKSIALHQSQRHVDGWADTLPGSCDNTSHVSPYQESQEQQWEKLSGNSSHLGTIKTATMSTASQSVVRSRRTTQSTTNPSIKSDLRASIDSLRPALSSSIDEEAQKRAIKRRQVLQEIISTENDYIFGLKALTSLLLYTSARAEVYHNVQRIRETHEHFYQQIRAVVPIAKADLGKPLYNVSQKELQAVDWSFKGIQSRSARMHNLKASLNYRHKASTAEAHEALVVAREIGKLSRSFANYKEFCDNYQLMVEDAAVIRKSVRNGPAFEQGVEAIAKSTASTEARAVYENKSMCLNDLLVKPAQRLCKYPLLLQELLKYTHIQDDPSVHDEIRQILEGVRASLAGINEATTNPLNTALVDKTFSLQEMLEFPDPATSFDIYKQLGPMSLCGVLHVTYHVSRHVVGVYMVCVLFKHHFFLAKMNDEYRKLRPIACLYINDVKIDSPTNGKGIEYFCLFSWKLIFQYQGEKFEIVLSASSATEERRWKTGILKSAAASTDVHGSVSSELRACSFLSLDVNSLEQDSTLPRLSRRPSVHSLAIKRTRSESQHVIIKKTYCPQKHGQTHQVDGEIDRPKTPSSYSAVVLTAKRQDRIRLERAILPIYTRDALPYPGMFLATGEILFGSSSLMRHLSLRAKRYKRSRSVNLPTSWRNVRDSPGLDKDNEKMQVSGKTGRREASESSIGLDNEKGRTQRQDSSIIIGRSKTMKTKSSPKLTSSSQPQPAAKGDKSSEHSDAISLKTIRSVINSMSLRKSRKNARPSLSGA